MRARLSAIVLLSLVATGSLLADDSYFYAGGSIGVINSDAFVGSSSEATYLIPERDNQATWKAQVGYRVNDLVSVEAAYHDLKTKDDILSADHPTGGTLTLKDLHSLSVSGLVYQPIMPGLEAFGKVGIANVADPSTNPDTSSGKGTDLLVGIGANYQLNESWDIRGEYERFNNNINNTHFLSLGAQFNTY